MDMQDINRRVIGLSEISELYSILAQTYPVSMPEFLLLDLLPVNVGAVRV